MSIVKICAVFIVAATFSLMLREKNHSFSVLIGITGIVIVGAIIISKITPVFDYISEIGHINTEIVGIIIRVLGIAYLTEFASSICRDSGDASLASGVEMIGKTEIIIVGFPLFRQLIDVCTEMLK